MKENYKPTWRDLVYFVVGILFGLCLFYFFFVFGMNQFLEHSNGIIQNLNIDLNETQLVEVAMQYVK